MTRKVSLFRQYLNSSRSIHYSLILVLPILAIYEFGIFILFRDSFFEMRNTGEVMLRNFFTVINLNNPYIISVILLIIFIGVMIRGYRIEKKPGVHANFLIYMMIESMLWGAVLYISLFMFSEIPLQLITLQDKLANMNLAIGAGIFEELVFRVVIITALVTIHHRGLGFSESSAGIFSIIIAAVIFAGFHLFMEPFTVSVFSQRIIGGVFLGTLYTFRGYGISVYSHIIYNFLILADTW